MAALVIFKLLLNISGKQLIELAWNGNNHVPI